METSRNCDWQLSEFQAVGNWTPQIATRSQRLQLRTQKPDYGPTDTAQGQATIWQRTTV